KYPKFASIVGSVVNIVKANPSIMDALKKYSGSSEEVILETLTYGSGPEVIVVDFGEKRDKVYGGYRRSVGKIEINEMIVEKFETLNAADESNKLAFVLCVFLLHESVHYGRHLNNLEKLYNELEAGEVFEIEAFGAEVNMYNADLISIKFKF
ncbi:MAG: hypothetical protein KA327_03805, partial [Pseudarcicella sp.]|nr:hypothetical protein [Pseudarcicella sp.]